MTPEAQAEILNRLPEVVWDRTAGDDERRVAFGWANRSERSEDRRDFVVLVFEVGDGLALVTSSARYSAEWHRRLFGPDGPDHQPCVRITDHYGDRVASKIDPGPLTLARGLDLDPSLLGQ